MCCVRLTVKRKGLALAAQPFQPKPYHNRRLENLRRYANLIFLMGLSPAVTHIMQELFLHAAPVGVPPGTAPHVKYKRQPHAKADSIKQPRLFSAQSRFQASDGNEGCKQEK